MTLGQGENERDRSKPQTRLLITRHCSTFGAVADDLALELVRMALFVVCPAEKLTPDIKQLWDTQDGKDTSQKCSRHAP